MSSEMPVSRIIYVWEQSIWSPSYPNIFYHLQLKLAFPNTMPAFGGIHMGIRLISVEVLGWFSMSEPPQFTHEEKITTFRNKKIWVHFQFFIGFPFDVVEPAFLWLLDNGITSLIPISSVKALKCDMQFQRKREKERDIFSSMKI